MPLPWVRLDTNIATHDKILALLHERDGSKAFVLYICGLGYAGGHSTDGRIPEYALPVLHGNKRLAQMLINHRLWKYNGRSDEYVIHNWDHRQELAVITESRQMASKKGNCIRWHGSQCECWKDSLEES